MTDLVRETTTNVRLKGIEFVAVLCNILDFHAVRGRGEGGRGGGGGRGRGVGERSFVSFITLTQTSLSPFPPLS